MTDDALRVTGVMLGWTAMEKRITGEYPFARSPILARSFSFPETLGRNSECPVSASLSGVQFVLADE
jgi:hypothetical protein